MPVVSSQPDGCTLTRTVMALANSGGGMKAAGDFAAHRWGPTSKVALSIKDAVEAGSTFSEDYSDIASLRGANTAFFTSVRAQTIIGRLSGVRRMPPRTKMLRTTAGISSQWIGEAAGKPINTMVFAKQDGLELRKLVTPAVITRELLESSDPNAETIIRAEMVRSISSAENTAFIDPANAGETGVKPASVTYGLSAIGGGSPSSTPEDDFEELIQNYTGDLERAYLVMSPLLGAKLSGQSRPNIGARGGEWAGVPVITSADVPAGTIVLIDPTGIALIEGPGSARTSDQASIQMVDESTLNSATPTPAQLVSMWQTNSLAIMTGRFVNWAVARPGAVSMISDAAY